MMPRSRGTAQVRIDGIGVLVARDSDAGSEVQDFQQRQFASHHDSGTRHRSPLIWGRHTTGGPRLRSLQAAIAAREGRRGKSSSTLQ